MTHQPAISFSISLQRLLNRAGGRTSNVRQEMNTALPQDELDGADPYQVYIHLMLGVSCDSCARVFEIDPPFGENGEYSWNWYRIAADQTRRASWWISPFTPEGEHPMKSLCPACQNKAQSD